jgi:membrane protein DedA with SNARE-associated domain
MSAWLLDFVHSAGYAGIALLMFLETVFPPIPSEIIMPVAGYHASQEKLSWWGALAAGTGGSVAGAVAIYLVGRGIPVATLKRWTDRHGRWLTVSRGDIDASVKWFRERGWAAVFLGRLVPAMRSLISIPAGLGDMPFAAFLFWTTAGSLLWNAALAGAGYGLGSAFRKVDAVLGPASWAVAVLLVGAYAWRVIRYKRPARKR